MVVRHLCLVRHRWRQANDLGSVINDCLVVDLDVGPRLADIVHELARVGSVPQGVLSRVFGVDAIVGRVLVLLFDFLERLGDNIVDLIFLLCL